MKLYAFSERSVELAKMLNELGFDIITRYHSRCRVALVAETPIRRCELDSSMFPEIDVDESVDIRYIINFAEINDFYMTQMRGHS